MHICLFAGVCAELLACVLAPFCGLGLEMLENGVLVTSWAHLRPGFGNAPKTRSGSFLGPFCGLGLEMLQNGVLGTSWAHSGAWGLEMLQNHVLGASWAYSGAWAWKCSKWHSGSFLGPFCDLGLEMLQNDVCSKTPVPTVYVFMR